MTHWPLLYLLDTVSIAVFLGSYYFACYRRGFRIDIWHTNLFLFCVLPNMIIFPATTNILNVIILRGDYGRVVEAIPKVFLITQLGFYSMLLGGFLWNLSLGMGARDLLRRCMSPIPSCSLRLMNAGNILLIYAAIFFLSQVAILSYYFSVSGFGFDLRKFSFDYPSVRPIIQIILNGSVFIGGHCLARYVERRERIYLFCTLALSTGLLFFGIRSNIIAIYLNIFLCYVIGRRERIGLSKVFFAVTPIILLGLYLGNLRGGSYDLLSFFESLAFLILFGNNFSDLRDFAWVYSHWNGIFWYGKTYLASLIVFLPRFISPFRDTWSFGAMTANVAGLDPLVHPGLRPSASGEVYFNFGVIGVVLFGLLWGVLIRGVDLGVKRSLAEHPGIMTRAYALTAVLYFTNFLSNSLATASLLVIVAIYTSSWVLGEVEMLVK